MNIRGKATLRLLQGQKLLREWHETNLVVTVGKNLIAAIVESASATRPGWMAIGDDSSVSTAAMTALQGTELERVAFDSTSRVDNELTYVGTFGSGIVSPETVGEVGLFNANSAGTMLARFVTSEFTIDTGYTLEVTWTLAFGD